MPGTQYVYVVKSGHLYKMTKRQWFGLRRRIADGEDYELTTYGRDLGVLVANLDTYDAVTALSELAALRARG